MVEGGGGRGEGGAVVNYPLYIRFSLFNLTCLALDPTNLCG